MKNAVQYKGVWLMPNSTAKELLEIYRKSGDSKDQKKLNDHMNMVDETYRKYAGLV